MPTALETMLAEKVAKTEAIHETFEKKRMPDGTFDFDAGELEDLTAKRAELDALSKTYYAQVDLADFEKKNSKELEYMNTPRHPSAHGAGDQRRGEAVERKTLGQLVVESKGYKEYHDYRKAGGGSMKLVVDLPDLDVKTVMSETGTGFAPPNYRTSIVVLSAQRRPVVADLIPQTATTLEAVKYMLETTFTNAAAAAAEGGVAASSLLGYTEEVVVVQWIPTILPVTEQQLEDVPSIQGIINNRLTLMVGLTEEAELVTGSGSSPHLQGFLTASGINTQAMGTDPIFDAILKGITQVRYTGFAEPSGIVMHPTDWQTARLMKTTIGSYIMGSPDTPGPEMLFGLPVVVTPVITQGTSLLGAFNLYSEIYRRWGLRIETGYVNDDFSRGQKTLRAASRLALVIYRPSAFGTVTGIHA